MTVLEPAPAEAHDGDALGLCGSVIGGKYRVVSVVGRGGFGVVYRGVHDAFGEPIAIKCLDVPANLGAADRAVLLGQLQEEGAVLHRLSKRSTAIVQALDVGAVTAPSGRWTPYLVLEWLEGETLAERLAARRGSGAGGTALDEAIRLLDPAAQALALAHRHGVAHRDVKPANLLVCEIDGHEALKVLDFGIAKVLAADSSFSASPAATGVRASAFTPRYGAPEQFNRRLGATGPWTDVFALALVTVEIVSGEPALDGDDPTQLYVSATDPAGRPTLRRRGVEASDEVERVLERALEIQPTDRYPDVGAFWEALRQGAGMSARPAEIGPTLAGDGAEATDALADTADFAARRGLAIDDARASAARAEATTPELASRAVRPARAAPPSSDAFELEVVELAADGVSLTVANVSAGLRLPPAQAEASLTRMVHAGRLVVAATHDDAQLEYRVAGLNAAADGRWRRLERRGRQVLRLLQVDRAVAPRLPPEKRKAVIIGIALATIVPGVGLIYAAPLSVTVVLTVLGLVIVETLGQLPLVGGIVVLVATIVLGVCSGILGGAYTWTYNRVGKRAHLGAWRKAAGPDGGPG